VGHKNPWFENIKLGKKMQKRGNFALKRIKFDNYRVVYCAQINHQKRYRKIDSSNINQQYEFQGKWQYHYQE